MTTLKRFNSSLISALLSFACFLLSLSPANAQGACIGCSEWEIKNRHSDIRFERNILDNEKTTLSGSSGDLIFMYIFSEKKSVSLWLIPENNAAHRRLLNRYKDYYSPEEDTWKQYLDNGAVITIHHLHHEDFGWFFILY